MWHRVTLGHRCVERFHNKMIVVKFSLINNLNLLLMIKKLLLFTAFAIATAIQVAIAEQEVGYVREGTACQLLY